MLNCLLDIIVICSVEGSLFSDVVGKKIIGKYSP